MKENRFRDSAIFMGLLVFSLLVSMIGIVIFEGGARKAADSAQLDPLYMGDVLAGSLQRAWLKEDLNAVDQTLLDIGEMPNVRGARVIDCRFQLIASSDELGDVHNFTQKNTQAAGCIECHQYSEDTRPRAIQLEDLNIIRISTPISRPEEFDPCESDDVANMGVLLIDVPITGAKDNFYLDLTGSILSLLLMGLSVYLIVNYLVLRRLTGFHQPLARFAEGHLASRIPISSGMTEELRTLAGDINNALDQYEHTCEDIEKNNSQKLQIALEERERIARDLHDGLAQILTFINTKSAALRMMIQNNDVAPAIEHLQNLEAEAQNLLLEVRMTIWGLRAADRSDTNLIEILQNYVSRFSRVSQIPVKLTVSPDAEEYIWDAGVNLQLFRIVQEALNNIRKHAEATCAWIRLENREDSMCLMVGDNGKGFDIKSVDSKGWHHYGTTTMQERARSIGGELQIISESGLGTKVIVTVNKGLR
jgi:signal transduction histidine kinase